MSRRPGLLLLRLGALLGAVLGGLLAGACSTRRTLWIESTPPGASVWVDGVPRGTTPVALPFVHYGGFALRLEHPGYASWSGDVGVASEIDGYPVVDLPYELLVRQKQWRTHVRLEPLPPRPGASELDEVLERARGFRERTRREAHADGAPPSGRSAR